MRTMIVMGGLLVAAGVAFTAYRTGQDDDAVAVTPASERPGPTNERALSPPPAAVPAPTVVESRDPIEAPGLATGGAHDDGVPHGQENVAAFPLENPPPSREEFGADPASELAALEEARVMLEELIDEADPETRAEIVSLLESIEPAR